MDEREKLLTQSMRELFIKLSIPGMMGMLIIGLYNFVDAIFVGLGKGKEAGIVAITRQIVFFIPLVLVLPRIMGVEGVWLSLLLSDLLCMIISIVYQKRIFSRELSLEISS